MCTKELMFFLISLIISVFIFGILKYTHDIILKLINMFENKNEEQIYKIQDTEDSKFYEFESFESYDDISGVLQQDAEKGIEINNEVI